MSADRPLLELVAYHFPSSANSYASRPPSGNLPLQFLHFIKPGEEAPTLLGEIRDVSVGVLATIAEKVYNDSLVASKPLEYAARAG
ncbi:MAG: hypothetical protein M3R63_07705 [Actinomycetota bacterium]|nr:hypothetical protein [Actinomycetota bacterium]